MKPLKIVAITIGGLIGVAHIGLIGYVLRPRVQPPTFNIPRGDYSSYKIKAGKDGYEIEYRANDPKVLESSKSLTLDKKRKDFLVVQMKKELSSVVISLLWMVFAT